MSDDLRARADRALERALAAAALDDPRPWCRARLKQLRTADPDGFDEASRRYDEVVVPQLAAGEADPVTTWIEYGRALAEKLTGPGKVVGIDVTGRATPFAGDPAGLVVLHLPDRASASILSQPAAPTPPQAAAVKLLVEGRREL